jgi:transglutaminase-like putative cysteine protease
MTTKVRRGFYIPYVPGDAQAKQTLRQMQHLVNGAIQDHEFVWWVRGEINAIAPVTIESRDYAGVARAIRSYVAAHIRFSPDPDGIENITPPLEHMKYLRKYRVLLGDCDDAATLSASMGKALGIPAEFRILAFWRPDSPYQHVVTYLHPRGGQVIDMDTTRESQKLPPVPTRQFAIRV